MSVSDVSNMFWFLGGLGMFLYGMDIMADGMQKSAGGKMSQFLGKVTNNRIMAVGIGALITAIIQSSGATTVMVVGFVSAGVLNLSQAVGVIMGANIGTTITAWIVSLSQLGSAMQLMKPAFYAPLIIGIGALMILFCKKEKQHLIGEIMVGLGLLFIGLDFMSGSISPYTDAPIFAKAFALLGSNPLLGMVIGAVVTALLQSSSASVGILQTLAMNGIVTTNAAIYITLGQNIGSCVTALLSGIGGSRTAKRAAVMHLSFNVIGSILFGVAAFVLFMMRPALAASDISAVQISMFHTVFNLVNTTLLFPFADQLVKLSGLLIKETEADKQDVLDSSHDEAAVTLRHLDERIFESPAFAVEIVNLEVVHMGQITRENVQRSIATLISGDPTDIPLIYKRVKTISSMEQMLINYLVKLNNLSLSVEQKQVVNDLFNSITDIKRVAAHTENLAEFAEDMQKQEMVFSESGAADLKKIGEAANHAFELAIEARRTGDLKLVEQVEVIEDQVDDMEESMREKHIERLARGDCKAAAGVIFLDIISNVERISDHAVGLAGYLRNEQ